ncbi:MAG TPA: V-type ATP synthase subunit D [Geobacteraceae bacterium]|nr:V-type ATP synthase subunit D [Geobacteraceae bacterium]
MISPTRTNLLLLKDKARSVTGSIGILKARRLALIREFLATSAPFLRSRDEIRTAYARAIIEMRLSLGHEGEEFIESLQGVGGRELGVEITERSVMGLRYRDVTVQEDPVRTPEERGYDYRSSTLHLEETLHLFESIIAEMLEIAAFESRMKRLGDEIVRITRRTRVLEERVLPDLRQDIKGIGQYIGERERESYYRLKQFKEQVSG